MQANVIPDLNKSPPADLTESDQGRQHDQIAQLLETTENLKGKRLGSRRKNVLGVKKSQLKPKRTGRYARMTLEQKKIYSKRTSDKHKIKFASWVSKRIIGI